MPGNIHPLYTRQANIGISGGLISAANTAMDGTGTVATVFSADSTNGSFVQRIRFKAAGTNVQSVARIFLNNGGSNSVPANNILFEEVTLPATTASANSSTPVVEAAMNIPLPAGWKILVVLGTAVAAGWYVSVPGGDY